MEAIISSAGLIANGAVVVSVVTLVYKISRQTNSNVKKSDCRNTQEDLKGHLDTRIDDFRNHMDTRFDDVKDFIKNGK